MKRLILLLVLCAVALGGYQLGRRPNSPDVVGWLRRQVESIDLSSVAQAAGDAVKSSRETASQWLIDPNTDSASPTPPAAVAVVAEPPRPPCARCW